MALFIHCAQRARLDALEKYVLRPPSYPQGVTVAVGREEHGVPRASSGSHDTSQHGFFVTAESTQSPRPHGIQTGEGQGIAHAVSYQSLERVRRVIHSYSVFRATSSLACRHVVVLAGDKMRAEHPFGHIKHN